MKGGGCPNDSCGTFRCRAGDQVLVEFSDEEEVAEGVGSKLHVVSLRGVLVLGRIRCIGNTKEDVKGGFLPVAA